MTANTTGDGAIFFVYELVLLLFASAPLSTSRAGANGVWGVSEMTERAVTIGESSGEVRRRGRPKVVPDDRQRDHVVETGRLLFLERGFGRTTMDEVAARARISKQTLYRFFVNKSALFAAVVEAHRHSMLALPGDYDHLPLAAALAAIARLDIGAEEDRERHALLEMAFHESVAHPELRDTILVHGVELAHEDLTRWLERRAATEPLRIDDPAGLARIFMDLVFGASRPPRPGETEPAAARRRRLEQCIEIFLRGILPR
jgi:AcrR family transcriptional regulator